MRSDAPLHDLPLVFFDVETTGASPRYGERVTEIGLVRVERGAVVDRYQQLVDPQRRIAPGVVALTGITQRMVDGQPTFCDVLPELARRFDGAVVVGHNVAFDLGFLAAECVRGRSDLAEKVCAGDVLDTVRIARRRFGRGGNGLSNLARRLDVDPGTAHRALADALTTAGVFARMLEPLGGYELPLGHVVELQGGPVRKREDAPRPAFAPRRAPTLDPSLPLELADALTNGGRVCLTYLDARGRPSERVIAPQSLREGATGPALVAFCHLRGELRTFKLDRVVSLAPCE